MEYALNYKQLNWVCNLEQDEGEKVMSLLETGKWSMVWDEEGHSFVLKRTAPVWNLLAKEGNDSNR